MVITTEEICKLSEANMLMASLIDRLFVLLLQYQTIEEIEKSGILHDIEKAAVIMNDYE